MNTTILALDLGTHTGWALQHLDGTITSGTERTVTFPAAGEFPYYCDFHFALANGFFFGQLVKKVFAGPHIEEAGTNRNNHMTNDLERGFEFLAVDAARIVDLIDRELEAVERCRAVVGDIAGHLEVRADLDLVAVSLAAAACEHAAHEHRAHEDAGEFQTFLAEIHMNSSLFSP